MSIAKLEHCLAMANDYLVICFIPLINHDHKLELIKAVTGWNTGWVELLKVSERIMTTMRLFNIREGFTAADDEFPLRYYQPKADGILSRPEAITDPATMGDARKWYYYYMGWDDSGVPTQEKLAELGLI
jgi:aldehyde:ferredoxin oxidoreductase